MSDSRFTRTELLLGKESMDKIASSHVAIFGVGGVGGYVTEALARSGIGKLTIVDKDAVDITNINRQIIALTSTVGRPKVEVMKERIHDINPSAEVFAYQVFYLPDTADQFDFGKFDFVVDAVDTVTAKLLIIEQAKKCNVPVISSMGAGNKTDPTRFRIADIYNTQVCPLAKVMRHECRKRGIEDLKVVYSDEMPVINENCDTVGSSAFVPSAAGLAIASEVIRSICADVSQPSQQPSQLR
jgi:tRNA A37 threonylcarbamoyladenosine dehydratase